MPTEPLPPADTAVAIPPSVQRQIDSVAALHAAAYGGPGEAPAAPEPPAPPAPPAPPPAPEPPAPPAPPAAPEPPAPPAPVRAGIPDSGEHGSFEHRYLAMKGRFDQAQRTIGSMQEQMAELGDELGRVNNQLLRVNTGVPQAKPPTQPVRQGIRDEDVNTYGNELIDFVQRAARDAVAPDLARVSTEVQHTNQRVARTVNSTMHEALDDAVPEWRDINVNPRFKAWCRLPDVYSGAVRGKLLNAAFQAADAPRVVAFFQGFLSEEQATGQISAPPAEPPAAPAEAPRVAAVPLETLAAPGRAKPATGGSASGSAEKPVFTRAQISEFYVNVRKGQYAGREADKARDEAAIFAAQREGRVR